MSLDITEKVIKKRGRKPKNKNIDTIIKNEEQIDSDKEVIIAYLPINLEDTTKSNIFIKSENNINYENNSELSSESVVNNKVDSYSYSENHNSNGIYINKINVHQINITQNTKCWWCKNTFDTPNVVLPEYYFEVTFYCIGNFCSYNCVKAYNIDLNDSNIWKRESLINLMYYMTYNKNKMIHPSPSWLILKEFGGFMSIDDFRKNFETNNSDYILLCPPLISRQMQIEESYKKSIVSNKIDKLFYQENTYSLKRTKPVETSQLNLEKTMGLKRTSFIK